MQRWLIALVIIGISIFSGGCSVLNLEKKTAGLQVLTPETQASLFLDGEYLEKTPYIRKDLPAQTYSLRIVPEDKRYVEYETSITLHPNTLSVVTWKPGTRPETSGGVIYELEKLSGKQTQLSLITIPDRAVVSVDGGNSDFAPIILENIATGDHRFSVSMPSYETQEHSIQVLEGYRLNATVKLAQIELSSSSKTTTSTDTNSAPSSATISGNLQAQSFTDLKTSTDSSSVNSKNSTESGFLTQQLKIKPTNYFQNGKELLRVRDEASAEGIEIGVVEVGKTYPYLGEKKDGWYKIMFEGKTAWVSGSYVVLVTE